MKEPKAVHAFDVYEAFTKTGDDDAAQVYLKSEADRYIAYLKRIICRLMAKHYKREVISTTNYLIACGGRDGYVEEKLDKEKQCVEKWLSLADKFKEAIG